MKFSEQEAQRISDLIQYDGDTVRDVQVYCHGCKSWRTIYASMKEAEFAGDCDACRVRIVEDE